jgi:gliding motility-associated-like protein
LPINLKDLYLFFIFTQRKQLRMRKLYLFLTLIFLGFGIESSATHVVGGAITYEHLGGATYRLTFKMYKDCGSAVNPNPAQFPNNVALAVYDGTGNFIQTVNLPYPGQDTLNPSIDTCAFDPGVCVSQAIYTKVVNNLYPGTGGYHLVYQYCCRNQSIDNLPNAGGGIATSYHAYVPDNSIYLTNSSPLWENFPPVFVCANNPLEFDHGATDPDGDSLAYKLYHPFDDGAFTWVPSATSAPNEPNFNLVPYNAGYDFESPLEPSAPANTLEIDINTGVMNYAAGANPIVGQHVVGIMVEEWRNGVLLSRIYRDFQFNVLNCPPPALAGIGPVDACNGTSIQMINNSTSSANGFEWDFGDGSPNSTQYAPSHTYPSQGPYTITLYAQAGTPCADTATLDINISDVTADFTTVDTVCVQDPVNFVDNSSSTGATTVNQWNWNFGDASQSNLPNPSHTYTAGGDFTVQLIATSSAGCKDTTTVDLHVQAFPVADAGPDTTACENNPLINLNGSSGTATGGLWLGQGGTFNPGPTDLNASYTPSQAELDSGYTILTLSTTGNGYCPADGDSLLITFVTGPSVDAGPDLQVCSDTSQVPLNGTVVVAGGGQWTTSGTGSFSPTDDDLNASYIPTSADTAAGSVMIYLTTTQNANCIAATDSMEITFFDPPTMSILAEDTACQGDFIVLDGNTTTGAGFWLTDGSGTFTVGDSTVQTSYEPSAADDANGQVTFVFQTLNNGGCQQLIDSLVVDILPSPTPDFTFTEVCLNDPSTFTDNSTSTDPITGYEWLFDGGNSDLNQNTSFTFGTPGTHDVSLIVYTQNGCSDTLNQNVEVHYLPEVGFVNTTPCLNGGSLFNDTSSVTNSSIVAWNWNFGDGNSDTVQNPLNVYGAAGTYSVTLVATSAFGCVDSATQTTTVLPGPTADFSANPEAVNMFEDIFFTDLSTPQASINSWFWDFGDNSGTSTIQNPTYAYSDTAGTFSVLLVVSDTNGCADSLYKDVVVFMPPIVPSGFSPNGDGENDILYVYGGPYKELQFEIYNNWGQLIFVSTDETLGWDGTYKNVDQPMSVYVYKVRAVTQDDVINELHGDVTLLR